MLPVTSLTACVLAPMFVALTVNAIRRRRSVRIAVGDGGDDGLARAARAQGNFAECVPLVLILTALAELNGAPAPWLALLVAAFAVGRVSHAYGLLVAEPDTARPNRFRFRVFGMATTLTVIGLLVVTVLAALTIAILR